MNERKNWTELNLLDPNTRSGATTKRNQIVLKRLTIVRLRISQPSLRDKRMRIRKDSLIMTDINSGHRDLGASWDSPLLVPQLPISVNPRIARGYAVRQPECFLDTRFEIGQFLEFEKFGDVPAIGIVGWEGLHELLVEKRGDVGRVDDVECADGQADGACFNASCHYDLCFVGDAFLG